MKSAAFSWPEGGGGRPYCVKHNIYYTGQDDCPACVQDRSAAKPPLGECPLTASHTRRACDNGGSCWCVENPDEVAAINAHPEVRKERSAATVEREYVIPWHTGTNHLVSFESASSVASLCGRSWPLRDVGLSTRQPRGPLCLVCRRAEARMSK